MSDAISECRQAFAEIIFNNPSDGQVLTVDEVVSHLPNREKMIIRYRYGLDDGRIRDLDACCDRFTMSRPFMQELIDKTMKRLIQKR